MHLLTYGAWRVVSRQWDAPHKPTVHGKWYLMVYSDFKRNPDVIDYPIIYADKSVGFEFPEKIPQGLRSKIRKMAKKGLVSLSATEDLKTEIV